MEVVLASPRGFCAGVDRAIETVELALERYGPPVYVRHEIVHNRHVVESLRAKGAVFIEDPSDAPEGAHLVFSAHGVSPAVRNAASKRGLRALDATCPLVTKVHVEAQRFDRKGHEIVLVGHAGHVEVEGTMGHAPERMHLVESVADVAKLEVEDPTRLACLTQTTLSVDDTAEIMAALHERFPEIALPRKDDICYATQNRQNAVKDLSRGAEVVLVVGAPTSSNSNRLVELAEKCGARGYLVETAEDIQPDWIEGVACVGLTAGASAPEILVEQVIERLRALAPDGFVLDTLPRVDEGVVFQLPAELRHARHAGE
ncbi:MAG: 4-hydroxy-3-methylbut-2-enyl diphosphate reductase [Deltaproteobacteria bacterium]|nr:4-hydroxy-3-methylbut-2-enyl diphosphate reductase [Deltaproteobacteria bacterium]MBW2444804.1 4-hydroxy-3-methylbut-2-enyl diphosphate reductase [Deltaproteobacteria bacterium]